jgi:hypothetical protein
VIPVSGALSAGRGMAAARFTETFKVYTVTRVLDEDTGLYEDTEVTVYASVAGRVKFPTLTVSERDQGAQTPAVQDVHVHVAVGAAPNAVVNTLWRVTASTGDSSLVGRVFRTKGTPQAGQVTAHRYPVEAVS